jgi:ribosomal protein S12 methylthiotransferase accessory factor
MFTNGKGSTAKSCLASALGEYFDRLSCNYFFADFYLGDKISQSEFVHYPNEKWFFSEDDSMPEGIMDEGLWQYFDPNGEITVDKLYDMNSGVGERGICALPYTRERDQEDVYIPVSVIANVFVSNGMSAGNTKNAAQTQKCLSEIFERAVKRQIIEQEIVLPDVPQEVLNKYPSIVAGINGLEEQGFPVVVKDASLGGQFPVMCVTLMNPKTGGVFASFGAHPSFEVALERSLTELLQGRSFEGLNDVPKPTFNSMAVSEPENFVEHFIDSTGVISWRFFSAKHDYDFVEWDFSGSNEEETASLFGILESLGKEAYIAEFSDLGTACRILVPDYSEVYPVEDLIWDNTNKALNFREDILNLHRLSEDELADLVERLEESELDNYIDIITLIGIEFDENTVWGQLTILELKLLIYLALGDLEAAMELVEAFLQYNDNTIVERGLFYQAMHATLEVALSDDLEIEDYIHSFTRMFGQETMDAVVGSINGDVMFYGLTETSMKLEGLDRHLRLIESYKKLHTARAKKAGL